MAKKQAQVQAETEDFGLEGVEDSSLDAETMAEIERLAAEAAEEVEEISSGVNVEFDGEDQLDVEREAAQAAEELAQEVYEEAESEVSTDVADAATKPARGNQRAKASKKASKTASKQLAEVIDPDAAAAVLDAIQNGGLAVKVVEKATNAVDFVRGARSNLSYFTHITLDSLAQTGEATSSSLNALMLQAGYSSGTAASQSQQQMMLLPALGIATRDGKTLRLNREAPMFEAIQRRIEETAAPAEAEAA